MVDLASALTILPKQEPDKKTGDKAGFLGAKLCCF
jgi:hypothetical protein